MCILKYITHQQLEINNMTILNVILNQLSQNSTWRGLLLIATAVGVKLNPDLQNQIITTGLSAVGLINVIRKGK